MSNQPPALRLLLMVALERDAQLIREHLGSCNRDFHCERVEDDAGLRAQLVHPWDIVITDHDLPGFDSHAVLHIVKELAPDTPVIILSNSIGEEHAVASMKAGAQDYIIKDNLARLVPAIERELREAQARREHRQAQESIRHLAYHDSLTGLVNRAEFERLLEDSLHEARLTGQPHGLLYLDLDQFKVINDTCGHVAGDELLRQLAVVLGSHVRESDTLARLGGDEFGILLHHCGAQPAEKIAGGLLEAINDFRFVWEEKSFAIGGSIGLVIVDEDTADIGDLLRRADLACYAAKDLGRNRVHVCSAEDKDAGHRHGEMEWAARIRRALDEHSLVLYRQDIHPINGGNGHTELLVRLLDRDGRTFTPGAFIPAAERYSLMPAVDRWVVGHALAHIAIQDEDLDQDFRYFINLSGSSLSEASFFDHVRRQFDETGVTPDKVCFEITETAAISNLQRSVNFINSIRDMGCHFSLDDFGAGLGSFSYLKSIPVDYVKIDGSFVRDIAEDRMDHAIVEAINNIAHVAGLRTIAEFVESAQILDLLCQLGVDYAQGYHLDQPTPLLH